MALRFTPPGYASPPKYAEQAIAGIPNSLDRIFNAYVQAQELERQRRQQGVLMGLQYPGVDLETAGPMDVQRAYQLASRQGAPTGAAPLQEPTESPNVAALRRIFEQQQTQRATQAQAGQLGIQEMQADIALKQAQAQVFGAGGAAQLQTIGGSQFLVTPSRQGPRYQAAPVQPITIENQLRDEFNAQGVDFRTVRDAFARTQSSGQNPTPAGDLSLIFNYMKILDPKSVVRESEFANAETARPLLERIGISFDRIGSVWGGKKLTQGQRADFIERAKQLYGAQERTQTQLTESYKKLAVGAGVRPEQVVFEQGFSQQVPQTTPGEISQDIRKRALEELNRRKANAGTRKPRR